VASASLARSRSVQALQRYDEWPCARTSNTHRRHRRPVVRPCRSGGRLARGYGSSRRACRHAVHAFLPESIVAPRVREWVDRVRPVSLLWNRFHRLSFRALPGRAQGKHVGRSRVVGCIFAEICFHPFCVVPCLHRFVGARRARCSTSSAHALQRLAVAGRRQGH